MHPDDARSEVWESTAAIQQLVDLGYVDPLSDDAQENLKLVRLHQDFNLARVHLNVHQPGAALPIMERVRKRGRTNWPFSFTLPSVTTTTRPDVWTIAAAWWRPSS